MNDKQFNEFIETIDKLHSSNERCLDKIATEIRHFKLIIVAIVIGGGIGAGIGAGLALW